MADTIKLSSRGMSTHDLGTVKGRGRAVVTENYDDMTQMLPPSNRTKREQRAGESSCVVSQYLRCDGGRGQIPGDSAVICGFFATPKHCKASSYKAHRSILY